MIILMRSSDLAAILQDSRRRSLELIDDLDDRQFHDVPLIPIINPPLWEIGHVAWFQEKWVLRHLRGRDPILPEADSLWDSAAVAHDTRWNLPLPPRSETIEYARTVLNRVLDLLGDKEVEPETAYFHWLAVMHEDMHGEAFTYTRQTLGYPAPATPRTEAGGSEGNREVKGDAYIEGGEFELGARPGEQFVFDNEKWAHAVQLEPFRIARTPVTNAQFAEFVDDGGYRRPDLWSQEGRAWLEASGAEHPVYWVPGGGGWHYRHYDRIVPLPGNVPIIHVNWYEAEAWCRWARRRLPTEAEWELAAGTTAKLVFPWGDSGPTRHRAQLDGFGSGPAEVNCYSAGDSAAGCRQMIGGVWEWTASDFLPYPGFTADPYKEYSQPWFTPAYKVLRGGCWATRSRLIRNTWRNFYTKDRRDVFAGFRTCAL